MTDITSKLCKTLAYSFFIAKALIVLFIVERRKQTLGQMRVSPKPAQNGKVLARELDYPRVIHWLIFGQKLVRFFTQIH